MVHDPHSIKYDLQENMKSYPDWYYDWYDDSNNDVWGDDYSDTYDLYDWIPWGDYPEADTVTVKPSNNNPGPGTLLK